MSNGDKDDDKEIEDEEDPRDPIVDDDGFVNQQKVNRKSVQEWNRGGVKPHGKLAQITGDDEKKDGAEDYSVPGTVPLAATWGPETPYSNQIANGNNDDDKEIQDEEDPRDPIVDDDGFVNQYKMNKGSVQEWNRDGVKQFGSDKKLLAEQEDEEEDQSEGGDDDDDEGDALVQMYAGPYNTHTPEEYATDPKWTPAIAIPPHTWHPHKVEDAHKPDMAGPTMMKGSFDREVDTDMDMEIEPAKDAPKEKEAAEAP